MYTSGTLSSAGTVSAGTVYSGMQPFETLLASVTGGVTGGIMLLLVIIVVILIVATWMCVRQRNAVLKGQ